MHHLLTKYATRGTIRQDRPSLCMKNYRWIRPEPSPPASFSTSETVTIL